MGAVYEAEQLSMGRRVALKVLPFAAMVQEKSLQRFRNEVRAAAALNHPHIVSIYSVGDEQSIHFYAMQLVRGQTLAELVEQLRRESGRAAEEQWNRAAER
jgi:serine/threonine protein kinase